MLPQQKTNTIYLEKLRSLVLAYLKEYPVKIYLFGSRAKNKAQYTSDVDIALLPEKVLPPDLISRLQEKIEESTLPYFVDIVDLSKVNKKLRDTLLSEAIEWKD